ncbi:transmembrane amino acid transporter protein-domain-containing protein [Thelephora terrestris]|uniref:Transmembrane amino acid transporter protein-domain-containing protein n=1 Tax=Thelephora terrestris TaxID=56493 RepID=A0A9P6H3S6_9AGAM|nr:transmembrane amino acid transporter protein-domain-containing protein [Thelephora terrestris]
MVQPYGVTDYPGFDVESRDETTSEVTSLLGAASTGKKTTGKEGHATIASCIGNLSNTIVGSGMLTFPLALASAGIIPGVLTCMFSGGASAFGLYLLSRAATRAPRRHSSFFAVAALTYPKAATFFDAAIAIKCFGVSISYLIIIKSLMPNVVAAIHHDIASPNTRLPDWALSSHVWICLIMIILAPLSFLRHLNSLRHTSFIALFAIAYLVVVVVYSYFSPLEGAPEPGEIHLIRFTPTFLSTFPVQVFAFTCAQNLFPIYNELVNNSQRRMNIIIGTSIGSAVGIYEIIGVFGYLTFGSKVGANVIAMYPSTSIFIAVGQLAIAILVMFSYPMQVHPCRNSLDKIFRPSIQASNSTLPDDDDASVVDDHGTGEMSIFKHSTLTVAIVLSGFTIAYFVDNLQMVLSFVGSTGSTTVSFILPGLFFWKLTRNDPETSKALNRSALGLAIYGMLVFIFCLSYNVYNLVRPLENHYAPLK